MPLMMILTHLLVDSFPMTHSLESATSGLDRLPKWHIDNRMVESFSFVDNRTSITIEYVSSE